VFDINGGIKSLEMALAHIEPTPGDSGGAFVPGYGSYNGLWQGDDQQNRAEEDSEWGDLPPVGGVMIGREAWSRPWMLCDADVRVFGEKSNTGKSRRDVLEEYCRYAERMMDEYDSWGVKTSQRNFMKPIFGIFALEPVGLIDSRGFMV
jgi:tRNA-dihydrouridine synthase